MQQSLIQEKKSGEKKSEHFPVFNSLHFLFLAFTFIQMIISMGQERSSSIVIHSAGDEKRVHLENGKNFVNVLLQLVWSHPFA